MCSVYLFFMQTTGKKIFLGVEDMQKKNQKNCGYFKKNLVEFYLIG